MKEIPLCSIVIAADLSPEEKDSLISAIKLTSAKVQDDPSRFIGIDDILEAIIVSIVASVITEQVPKVTKKIAKAIIDWRTKARAKGKKTPVKLEHPERNPLDLETATDEEIEEWLSQQ